VETRKLRDYCLSPEHPRGRHKARVFASALGLTVDDYQDPLRAGRSRLLDLEHLGRARPVAVMSLDCSRVFEWVNRPEKLYQRFRRGRHARATAEDPRARPAGEVPSICVPTSEGQKPERAEMLTRCQNNYQKILTGYNNQCIIYGS